MIKKAEMEALTTSTKSSSRLVKCAPLDFCFKSNDKNKTRVLLQKSLFRSKNAESRSE